MLLLDKYNQQFLAALNEQLAVYTTIGTPYHESPMWFQYQQIKDGNLFFKSSQRGHMFFNIPLLSEDIDFLKVSYDEIYTHFRELKYSHIKENWPTVYYEIRPNEKPVTPKPTAVYNKPEELPTDYKKQAADFLTATGTEFKAVYKSHDFYFDGDKETRDIYNITLKNSRNRFRFTFGQSLNNTGIAPTPYDVLACLTKYDVGSFENFCGDFGYDVDSRKAYKTYKAVLREWKNVELLWTPEEIELLQEIQ